MKIRNVVAKTIACLAVVGTAQAVNLPSLLPGDRDSLGFVEGVGPQERIQDEFRKTLEIDTPLEQFKYEQAKSLSFTAYTAAAYKDEIFSKMQNFACKRPEEQFNQVYHNRFAAGPTFPVRTPNADTLYSTFFIDTRVEPMVITIPDMEDRYWSIMTLDSMGNNYGPPGVRRNGKGGPKHFLYLGRTSTDGFLDVQELFWKNKFEEHFDETLLIQDELVWLTVRTEILAGEQLSPEPIWEFQDQMIATPLTEFHEDFSRFPIDEGDFPNPCDVEFAEAGDDLRVWKNYNTFLTNGAQQNEWQNSIQRLIGPASIGEDGLPQDELDNVEESVKQGLIDGTRLSATQIAKIWRRSGVDIDSWTYYVAWGDWGDEVNGTEYNFLLNAASIVSYPGYLEKEEAFYPETLLDGNGNPYDGSKLYRMHIPADQIPEVDAFWSLSLYASSCWCFVDNMSDDDLSNDRYNLKDTDLVFNEDGSLDLYMGNGYENPGVPNWLPAHPDDEFYMIFRLYNAGEDVLTLQKPLPAIFPVDASALSGLGF